MIAILLAFVVGISDACPNDGSVSVRDTYVRAVQDAGFDAVVIPRSSCTNSLRRIVRGLDLVVLTGGEDVAPWRYGEAPSPRLGVVNAARDVFDFALLAACRLERKPMLGICRGCQALNVAFGGTLVQDIPTEHAPPAGQRPCVHRKDSDPKDQKSQPLHEVSFVPGTRLAAAFGAEPLVVNTYHHQAAKRVAPGFRIVAQATDGVIEAIEHETLPIYGVQFHPELTAVRRPQTGFDLARYLGFFRRLPSLVKTP